MPFTLEPIAGESVLILTIEERLGRREATQHINAVAKMLHESGKRPVHLIIEFRRVATTFTELIDIAQLHSSGVRGSMSDQHITPYFVGTHPVASLLQDIIARQQPQRPRIPVFLTRSDAIASAMRGKTAGNQPLNRSVAV